MKKIIILIPVFLLAFFASCKKDSKAPASSGTYYVKFQFNGTEKQYSASTTGILGSSSAPDGCEIIGYGSGANPPGVTISIVDNSAITTNKTYTQTVGIITYVDESGTSYVAGSVYQSTALAITIEEIASDHIKGTFSAKFQKAGTTDTYLNATEGQFYVNRLQ
jgi:hypothetical protein